MAIGVFFRLLLLALASVSIHAQCTDVHVVFARGSGEMQGLGICGTPLVSGIKNNLQGKSVSSHAVVYAADLAQTSAGPGATAMTKHVVDYAKECPNAVFVIGGYSQGGSVTDIAIGIKTMLGTGQTIPTELAPRVKAVVVFGNPLKLFGQTIEKASPLYGSKAIEFCNVGDPVCAAGANMMAHLTYATDGSVTKAAQRAAQLVTSGGGGGATASTSQTAAPAASGNSTSQTSAPGMPAGSSAAPAPAPAPAASTPSSGGDASGGMMSKLSGLFGGGGAGGMSGLSGLSGLFGGGSGGSGGSGLSGLSGLFGGGGAGGMSGLSGLSGLFGGGATGTRSYNFGNLRGGDE